MIFIDARPATRRTSFFGHSFFATRVAAKDNAGRRHESDDLDDLPLFQPSATTGITREIVKAVETILTARPTRPCAQTSSPGSGRIFIRCSSATRVEVLDAPPMPRLS